VETVTEATSVVVTVIGLSLGRVTVETIFLVMVVGTVTEIVSVGGVTAVPSVKVIVDV
jgi:hypothetical protein